MDKNKLLEIENLFDKYGFKSKKLIESEKKFLHIETYKIDLNINKTIYRDKLVKNGGNGSACIILALFDNDDVLLVVQPRVFSKRGVLLDIPSGYIDNNEEPLKAALRELKEETGYEAESIKEIASYYQDEGVTDSIVHIFMATGLKKVSELSLDEDEFLEPVIVKYDDIQELIDKGYIKSGGSQLAYYKSKLLRGENSEGFGI